MLLMFVDVDKSEKDARGVAGYGGSNDMDREVGA